MEEDYENLFTEENMSIARSAIMDLVNQALAAANQSDYKTEKKLQIEAIEKLVSLGYNRPDAGQLFKDEFSEIREVGKDSGFRK